MQLSVTAWFYMWLYLYGFYGLVFTTAQLSGFGSGAGHWREHKLKKKDDGVIFGSKLEDSASQSLKPMDSTDLKPKKKREKEKHLDLNETFFRVAARCNCILAFVLFLPLAGVLVYSFLTQNSRMLTQ